MHPRILASMSAIALVACAETSAHANAPHPATLKRIASLSVPFVPNAGQWDARAAFAAHTFAGTLFVTTAGELVYSLPGKPIADDANPTGASLPQYKRFGVEAARTHKAQPRQRTRGWALSETLVDGNGQPRSMANSTLKAPAGFRPVQASVSYFIGNDETRHTSDLNTYERVNLGDMYPGINVQLRATGNNVEKIFTVAPQQDPTQINIKIAGAQKLELGDQGELIAHTGNGPVTFTAPIAFQETTTGKRTTIDVAYALDAAQSSYRFTLGDYDKTQPLIIDPLLQSSYLGAAANDSANAMAIHPISGDVYVTGYTSSAASSFPGVSGGDQGTYGGGTADAFVSRFSADLTTLIRSSYLGAAGDDQATALAFHPTNGQVYVAGFTSSPTTTFPGVGGGAQGTYGGGTYDGFVSRFSADLSILIRSSYLGAAGDDQATALAVHQTSGAVYVAGHTTSTGSSFPGVSGSALGSSGGGTDGFVSRFSADLATLVRSSYLGASGSDVASALAIHPASGEVYVAGHTSSTTNTFPGVSSGAQGTSGGGFVDGFVSRFSADLMTLVRSSYLGAAGEDRAYALAIHPASGEVYVAGITDSTGSSFPGVRAGAQTGYGGGIYDGFVSRFSADLGTLVRSSYLGATGTELANALVIHPASGEVYLAGWTVGGGSFPGVSGGAQGSYGGGNADGFVSRFSADLASLIRSSYLGAAGYDEANALAIHPASGEVYVAGYTNSTGTTFPGVTRGAQGSYVGGTDAFVSRFSADLSATDTTPSAFAFAAQTNVPLMSTRTSNPAQISGIVGAANIYVDGALGSQYCISSASNCLCDVSTAFITTPGTITNGNYVCVRHISAPITDEVVRSRLHVGGATASFVSTTGTLFSGNACSLDIDGSGGAPNAVSDGLMLVRAMLGFTGTAVTNGAIFGTPPRNTWALIRAYLNSNCGTSFAP